MRMLAIGIVYINDIIFVRIYRINNFLDVGYANTDATKNGLHVGTRQDGLAVKGRPLRITQTRLQKGIQVSKLKNLSPVF